MDDVWPCKAFLDESGAEIQKAQIYSFTDDNYNRIADYGLDVVATAGKNTLNIDGQQYSEDIDKLKSFLILPVASDITRIATLTLDEWQNHSGYTQLPSQPGLFLNNFTGYNSASGNIINNPGNVHDKDSTTFAKYNPTVQFGSSVPIGTRLLANAMRFSLPVIPKNIKVTNMYFGVKMKTHAQWINFVMRRFAYSNSDDIVVFTRNPNTGDDPNVDCLPDFYYNDAPETNNLHFYKESAKVGLTYENVFGYTLFKMPNCTPDIFNLYEEGAVISVIDSSDIVGNATTLNKIYELAIILELEESDIKKEIFSPVKGRIFNDTWGARKTATDQILNPVDMIECLKRLGDWSETGLLADFGKAYSSTAKIKLTGREVLIRQRWMM